MNLDDMIQNTIQNSRYNLERSDSPESENNIEDIDGDVSSDMDDDVNGDGNNGQYLDEAEEGEHYREEFEGEEDESTNENHEQNAIENPETGETSENTAKENATPIERRQSGRQSAKRNYADIVSGDYIYGSDDDNKESTENVSHVAGVIHKASAPLRKYFLERLYQVIHLLRGSEDSMKGWSVQIIPNDRGLLSGIIDIAYVSNRGRRYRNRVDVACSLGLMQAAKNAKSMSREQMFLVAMEIREKHLISQLLGATNGICDEIQYISDNATIMCNGKAIGNVLTGKPKPFEFARHLLRVHSMTGDTVPYALNKQTSNDETRTNIFFSFGNVTVLNWGTISPDPAFHSSTQIYPIGFKCIRQEHDVTLDKVVECLCEIDTITDEHAVTKAVTVMPLFRLSVAWVMNNGERRVRVYEARSPQQTWQAAMLETEGVDLTAQNIESNLSTIVREHIPSQSESSEKLSIDGPTGSSNEDSKTDIQSFESMDEEEILLRNQICEERRKYFRALRLEQKQGIQAAVVPRLSLDNVESFADEGIMRLIEGMQGALECEAYQFVDSREQEGGRRNIWRGYGTVNEKLKNLYKVARKSTGYSGLVGLDQLNITPGLMSSSKRKHMSSTSLAGSATTSVNPTNEVFVSNNDLRKKLKQDIKEQRVHSSSIQKTRNTYIKRLETSITNIRNNVMKLMRKRRDEIKYIIGGISDQEYQLSRNIHTHNNQSESSFGYIPDQIELDEHPPLPEPKNGMVCMDGNIFGDILEIWDYMQTFSESLDIGSMNLAAIVYDSIELPSKIISGNPDLFVLLNALKRYDPHFKRLAGRASGMFNSYDYASGNSTKLKDAPFELTQDLADTVVNTIGIALTKVLLEDYEHIMGIEAAKESIGSFKVPINALTWREIARSVLILGCGREIGISEIDLVSSIKGRGYFCTPETLDKKALRLCRKRILFQYQIRHELQESMYGFGAGICVRIPCPSFFSPFISQGNRSKEFWLELLEESLVVPNTYGWLVHDIVYASSFLCTDIKVKETLKRCLEISLDMTGTMKVKEMISKSLENYLESCGDMDALKLQKKGYADEMSEFQWPTAAWDLMREQFRYQYLCAKSTYFFGHDNTGGNDGMEEEENAEDKQNEDSDDEDNQGEPSNEIKVENTENAENFEHMETNEESADRMTNNTPFNEDSNDMTKSMEISPKVHKTMQITTDKSAPRLIRQSSLARGNKAGQFISKVPSNILTAMEYEESAYERLSTAMRRCHDCLIELMLHVLAHPFVLPVDRKSVAGYYNFISQPISLSEIQTHLIKGLYDDSIFNFYSDVMILLENSVAFNPESSPIHQSALKLVVIFERLFFEMVLTWDSCLTTSLCCHICRIQSNISIPHSDSQTDLNESPRNSSASPALDNSNSSQKMAVCERCEASYHLNCVDSRLSLAPRTDWYCLGCSENRSIAAIHPNKLTKVTHPSNSHLNGQVVGIEQIRQTVQFVVEFDDHTREMWNGNKVRSNAIRDVDNPEYGVPMLADGYNYDDYDAVCGLVRGYSGWGSFLSPIPSYLSDAHSYYARKRSLIDPFFQKSRLAIAWLGSANLTPEDVGIKEITTIFRSMAQRAMSSSALMTALSKQDESNGDALTLCADNISRGRTSYSTLIRKLKLDNNETSYRRKESNDDFGGTFHERSLKTPQNDEEASLHSLAEGRMDEDIGDANRDDYSDADILESDEVRRLEDNSSKPTEEKSKDPSTTANDSNHEPVESNENDTLDIEEWEDRRLCRRRGREDALVSHLLLNEIIAEADIDGEQELAEVGPQVAQTFGDFYSAAMPTIVKVCSVRPHEDLDVDEWTRGYKSKVIELQSMDANEVSNPKLCGYCGQDEFALCSVFVWGQTWSEFMDDKLTGDSKKNNRVANTKKRYRYSKISSVSSNTTLWKPCYQSDAIMEMEEAELVGREFVEGSLPVHECCAELMESCRTALLQHSQRTESSRVADIIAGIGRGKTTALGKDRDGNSYWVFCGLQGVFVCSESNGLDIPQAAKVAALDMERATSQTLTEALQSTNAITSSGSSNSSTDPFDRFRFREKNCWEYYCTDFDMFPSELLSGEKSNESKEKTAEERKTIWRLYTPDEDIAKIMSRLDKRHLHERTLYQALSFLFPEALNISKAVPVEENNVVEAAEVLNKNQDPSVSHHEVVETTRNEDQKHEQPNEITEANAMEIESNEEVISREVSAESKEEIPSDNIDESVNNDMPEINQESMQTAEVSMDSSTSLSFDDVNIKLEPSQLSDEGSQTFTNMTNDTVIEKKIPLRIIADDEDDETAITFVTEKKKVGRPPKSSMDSYISNGQENDVNPGYYGGATCFKFMTSSRLSLQGNQPMNIHEKLQIGDEIIVEGSNKNGLTWTGKIIDIKRNEKDDAYYKISYDQWDSSYDSWIAAGNVKLLASSSALTKKQSQQDNGASSSGSQSATKDKSIITYVSPQEESQYLNDLRFLYIQSNVSSGPSLLRSLRAYVYINAPHRHSVKASQLAYSSVSTSIEIIRMGMLMIEAALPVGAVDDSEDRWADDFVMAWREAVVSATDASLLMQAMVMLEYGIRTPWLVSQGLKLMSCLPSRIHALRNATIGLVALKLWTLDQCIKYDKINYPKGHPLSDHNTIVPNPSISKSKSSTSSTNLKSGRKFK